ncbi:hypothetical protein JCM11251_006881 [Rhodosporidiobolus azoricus]
MPSRPTFLAILTLALSFSTLTSALPRPNPKAYPPSYISSGAIDGAAGQRRDWGKRLMKRQQTFVLAPEGLTTETAQTAAPTTTSETTTTPQSLTTTTSEATPRSTSSTAQPTTTSETTSETDTSATPVSTAVSSSSSTSASPSSASSASASSSPASSISSSPSLSSASTSSSTSSSVSAKPTQENKKSGNIFAPSNRLFGLGVVIIIVIVLLALLLFIYLIKRASHLPRFADHRDYPEGFPRQFLDDKALSKRWSHTSQTGLLAPGQVGPMAGRGEEDATEMELENEFATKPILQRREARESPLQAKRPTRVSSLPPRSVSTPQAPQTPQPPTAHPPLPPTLKSTPLPALPAVAPPAPSPAPVPAPTPPPASSPTRRAPPPPPTKLSRKPPPALTSLPPNRQRAGAHPIANVNGGYKHPHSPPRGSGLRNELK